MGKEDIMWTKEYVRRVKDKIIEFFHCGFGDYKPYRALLLLLDSAMDEIEKLQFENAALRVRISELEKQLNPEENV